MHFASPSSSDAHVHDSSSPLHELALDSPLPDANDTSSLVTNSDSSSLTPELPITPIVPSPQIGNTHSMVTWSKAGIFKSRLIMVELDEREPYTIEEAFSSKEWKQTAQGKYDALIRNQTSTLLLLPSSRKTIYYKWLFKIKWNLDGTVAQRKGNLVGKGYS